MDMTRRFTPAGFCIVPAGHSVPAVRQKGAYPAGTLGAAGRHRVGRGVSSVRGLGWMTGETIAVGGGFS
jgi:hypothetical protein